MNIKQYLLIITIFFTGCIFFCGCHEPSQVVKEKESEIESEVQIIPVTQPPAIKFEKTEIDLGEIGPGTISKSELKFENTGQGVLKIEHIQLCCGTYAQTDKEQYEPGESGVLKIEYQDKGITGEIIRTPVVYTNDPKNPEIEINIKAIVIQKVVWEPEKIRLFLNTENASCPKLNIKSLDKQAFAIKGIKSTGDCITADYNPTVKREEFVLDLKVNMEKIPDNTKGEIEIRMNHPQGNIAIVYFSVVPKFDLSPKPLILFNIIENEPIKEKIKILNNYKENLEIESTSSKENMIQLIDYNKIEDDYELTIEITPPPAEGNIKFTDIFYINIKGNEQLALTCIGYYET